MISPFVHPETPHVAAATGRDPRLDPLAGHLFAVETGIRGLATNILPT